MGKGILTVGFPDSTHVKDELELTQSIEDDKADLRLLIYSCDKGVINKHARQHLDRELESSLTHSASVPDSLPQISQACLQGEKRSSQQCQLTSEPTHQHPLIKQISTGSQTSQTGGTLQHSHSE